MTDITNPAHEAPAKASSQPKTVAAQPNPKSIEDQASEDIIDLFLRKPLYGIIKGEQEYINEVEEILEGNTGLDFDNYCEVCGQVTPWTLKKYAPRHSGGGTSFPARYVQASLPHIRVVNTVCLRRQHFHTYILHLAGSTVQKIGQRPSMADIALGELKAIPGIEKQDRRELGRALGLFAHDTPLGAFVYLRRVFERMIARAHDRFAERHGKRLQDWVDLKMGQRISALAEELPAVVRSNSAVWGLLSKGIHELSDEDAAMLFPLVKAVIFEMLGEEERHRQAAIQSEATRKALADATARLKPTSSDHGSGSTAN